MSGKRWVEALKVGRASRDKQGGERANNTKNKGRKKTRSKSGERNRKKRGVSGGDTD